MNKLGRVILWLVAIVALALPFAAFGNSQAILDWWKLKGYTPPSTVVSLADQDTMTSYARHTFYVNHPQIESDASKFSGYCQETEKTIVLGCYHPLQNGIFVYDVKDPRLSGVEQVTAAHEMLHSAYDRLSQKDRQYVDGLLQNYYDNQLQDQRIKDTVDSYRISEPNDLVNEMHSIFGTEIANLPQPLEQYYKRYFSNRAEVAAFANNYQAEFTSRENQIKTDDAQLGNLKNQISDQEADLKTQIDQINSDRDELDRLRSAGQIQQYNAKVASFNREVDSYNNGVARLKSTISAYNSLVATRNAIAVELANLTKSIDTRQTPQPTQ
jgi:uncharacterized coiled-coil DUF342 family protein